MGRGRLNLRCAVDAIQLGHTYRHDLGDIDQLSESIGTVGLLHPIVVGPDGLLISGRRRLEAVRSLGWRQVPVWVATEVSDRLLAVMAVQHENTVRKDLTPVEAAELYAELKTVYAAEAARRQVATRFGSSHGAVESTAPQDARAQAARAITGRDSHGMLEQVVELRRMVADTTMPAWLRAQTEEALGEMTTDGKVNGRYLEIKAAQARLELEQAADDEQLPAMARRHAQRGLDNVTAMDTPAAAVRAARTAAQQVRQAARDPMQTSQADDGAQRLRLATFLRDHHGWWDIVDPAAVAHSFTDAQWRILLAWHEHATKFLQAAVDAHSAPDIPVPSMSPAS